MYHSSFASWRLLCKMLSFGCCLLGLTLQAQEVKLLSHQELAKKEYSTPYILHFQKAQKALLFVGSHHSNDPKDSLFNTIKDQLIAFEPTAAFNEGGDFRVYSTPDSTIRLSWEAGYLRYLCKQKGIPVQSIEPPQQEEYHFVLEKSPPEEAFLFYGYRYANQLKRQTRNLPSIKKEERLHQFLTKIGPELFEEDFADYTDLFKSLYREQFQFDFDFALLHYRFFAPTSYLTKLSQINRAISDFRDEYILHYIKETFDTHDRILIVMGAGHAVRQEQIWKAYFED